MTLQELREELDSLMNQPKAETAYQNFRRKSLVNVDFSNQDLRGSNFREATIKNCKFNNTILYFSNFKDATIENCDFTDAKVFGCPNKDIFVGADFSEPEELKRIRELEEQIRELERENND